MFTYVTICNPDVDFAEAVERKRTQSKISKASERELIQKPVDDIELGI